MRSGVNWWVCLDGAWTGNVIMDGPTSYRAYLIRWQDGLIAEEIRSKALYGTCEEAQRWCLTVLNVIAGRCCWFVPSPYY